MESVAEFTRKPEVQDILDDLRQFWDSASGVERQEFKRFIADRPEWESPHQFLPPLEELQNRLDAIKFLENWWKDPINYAYSTGQTADTWKPFTDTHIAALLLVDNNTLQTTVQIIRAGPRTILASEVARNLLVKMYRMPLLGKIFLAKGAAAEAKAAAEIPPIDDDQPSPPPIPHALEVNAKGQRLPIRPPPPMERSTEASPPEKRSKKTDTTDTSNRRKENRSDETDHFPLAKNNIDATRNRPQKRKRADYDQQACIFTKTLFAPICHIVPFSANEKEEGRKTLRDLLYGMIPFFDSDSSDPTTARDMEFWSTLASDTGISDRRWNMISAMATLHDWWGRAIFALKCLGLAEVPLPDDHDDPENVETAQEGGKAGADEEEEMVELKLQWHWMPQRARIECDKRFDADSFAGMFKKFHGEVPSATEGSCSVARPLGGRRIKTGDIFYVSVPKKHWMKMKIAFDFQWAMIRLTAMAGGADVINNHPFPDHLVPVNLEEELVNAGWLPE
ncbi:hypothetical protein V8F20_001244 [Naviculisporaceae sp. PSN 640]